MKISNKLSEQILETNLQIKNKFGISVGYSHPMGCFIDEQDDFIIYQEGDYNQHTNDFDYTNVSIIEYNPFEHETIGFMSRLHTDLDQKSDKISDFLIDFHLWLQSGQIKIEKDREYKGWKWKPSGDGRFHVERSIAGGTSSYTCFLEEFDEDDIELRDYIARSYGIID